MSALFGIIGVFSTPDAIRDAARQVRRTGYREFETYTPYHVEGLEEIVHPGPKRSLPLLMFGGAVFGAIWGYWIQFWDEAVNYPINVGGRPHDSWPAFMVGTFEFMLLCAVATGLLGLLAASRLPKLYHPLFDARSFARASRDRFLICIEANDPRFDADSIGELFNRLGAERIEEVRA
jgi:Alternative complex III, ActD subunit